ncbi:putative disease resistance RPP13-like protein 1 [Zingiber officinale]|uniref:Uncharacterized protein n=1 Tax=Zingiber officinale TaxID=94328 RepID=A0A8J5I0Q8_ZINOF|nr:putative disease resistance RPP13-like protein 1 [Zingiber officinale]KAG6530826.1 hypothetical protein ZIOFF_004584 [Zingiber officinale]
MALATFARVLRLIDSSEASIPPSRTRPAFLSDLSKHMAALKQNLTRIQVAIRGAEERQASDPSAKLWLTEITSLAYDAEDVLLDFDDLLPRPQIRSALNHSDSGLLLNSFSSLASISQRIKELGERLVELHGKSEALQLGEQGGAEGSADARRLRPTGSLMDGESPIFGREKDKENILELLRPSGDEGSIPNKLLVLPIVGMGGLGKTTLAQQVYADDQIKYFFDLRIWIHVSQDFNLFNLTKAMVESVTGNPCFLSELHSLQSELGKILEGKRFFLVLDDVWDESSSHWESLQVPLLSANLDSKVLLTTRSHGVARSIGTMPSFNLDPLKDDDAWLLFSENAFHGREPGERLVTIGKKIVKECNGVPLTLKALGLHLCNEEREDKWSAILESNIWHLSGSQETILPILMLSYLQLPAPVKQCFAYCSLFGKGHLFLRHKIVRHWIAQGFVETDGERKAEDVGSEYFYILLARSFFQQCARNKYFIMHDLIHDLAEYVSGAECFKIDVLQDEDGSRMNVERAYNFPEGVRHTSLTFHSTSTETDLQPLLEANSLRTLMVNCTSWPPMPHPHANVLNDLFVKLRYLRVLLLDYTFAPAPRLPDSISNLKYLHYLRIGRLSFQGQGFPESVCSLRNLQTLEWYSDESIELPRGISNLINLRHLHSETYYASFPEGIGRLTKLQELPDFHTSKEHGRARIAELKDLVNLQGELKLLNLENVIDVEDSRTADLKGKPGLTALELDWGKHNRSPQNAPLVLQYLQPHTNIQELRIANYKHGQLSEWICHPSYSKLVTIKIQYCFLSTVPAFGQLLSLEHLSLVSIKGLEYIGPVFFHGGFPSLKKLRLSAIYKMVEWSGAEHGHFPHLNELTVTSCPSLRCLPIDNFTSLKRLHISHCSNLQTLYSENSPLVGIQQHCSLKNLEVIQCPKLKFLPEYQVPESLQLLDITKSTLLINWYRRIAGKLTHVKNLLGVDLKEVKLDDIFSVEEARNACLTKQRIYMLHLEWETSSLRSVDDTNCEADEVLEYLQPNVSLNKLVIRGYRGLKLAEWLCSPLYSNLISIKLDLCPNCKFLPALGQLPYLMELHLERLNGITSIDLSFYGNGSQKGFQSLRRLQLMSMAGLEEWKGASDGGFPILRQLIVQDCMKLRGLPCLSPSVQEIKVEDCPALTLELPSSLAALLSLHVSNVAAMDELCNLSYLSVLAVENCSGCRLIELPSLRSLMINGWSERMLLDSLPGLTALTTLKISCLENLEALPLHNFRILEELVVSDCPKLVSIECSSTSTYEPYYVEGLQSLSALKCMVLSGCPELHFSASEQLPASLQSLTISRCPTLRIWYERYSSKFRTSVVQFAD